MVFTTKVSSLATTGILLGEEQPECDCSDPFKAVPTGA